MISRKNVNLFLQQTYSINEQQLFDPKAVNKQMRTEMVIGLLEEFTSSFYGNGELIARDPFLKKDIELTAPDFSAINSMDDVMKLLSETHKQRIQAVDQRRQEYLQTLERSKELEIEDTTKAVPDIDHER